MLKATVRILGRTTMLRAATIEELSAAYCRERDARGLGASQFSEAEVTDAAGGAMARISYNGRVWAAKPWAAGDQCIFDPTAATRAFP